MMNTSGKQQEVPPSHNDTHQHQTPIDADATYRIGLCGFRTRGSRKLVPLLEEAVRAAFNGFDGKKLLLLPGRWKCGRWEHRHSWPTVNQIAGVARATKLPILFETIEPLTKPFYTAVSQTGKQLPLRLYQQFANCKNVTQGKVERLVNECKPKRNRAVHIGGLTVGLLICGENNVMTNKQSDHNRAYVRYSPESPGANLFPRVQVIFNGAHDKMGEWGKLQQRFQFLSANKRRFFYATNNKEKKHKKEKWGKSTLCVYYDGERIATSDGPESRSSSTTLIKTCTVPLKGQGYGIAASLVTSKANRVRILTLDIPGKLLQ